MAVRWKNPGTRPEWQEAVNAAEWCLRIDAARQYGLIETDMRFDVHRCLFILERGKAMGITPEKQNWNL